MIIVISCIVIYLVISTVYFVLLITGIVRVLKAQKEINRAFEVAIEGLQDYALNNVSKRTLKRYEREINKSHTTH